ncbi:NADP-dependent oxidoreductase [Actinocorallia longicatena]|uniref:NADP-dependent oxidoreductase n=1 Tax=Actinocorallia longicatena TaxID=111803 RepID=A0ABP6QDM6_9ACTN
MRIVTQRQYGDPSVLTVTEVERPRPGFGQVLVKVGAAGVNQVDLFVRAGAFPLLTPPFTLGWDVAGTVEEVGPGITQFAPGDAVFGLSAYPAAGDAYAEYVLADPNDLARIPDGLSTLRAGALPLAALTAWQALAGVADLRPGQRVLVHRAAGGVGHLAVQIAKTRGAHVIGTASSAKHAFLKELGADELIDHTTADYGDLTGVDVVLDLLGGVHGEKSARVLRPGGLLVAAVGGNPGFDDSRAAALGVRFAVVSVRPSAHDLARVAALVAEGRLTVHIEAEFPLAEAAKAHELLASGRVTGKVVLSP